MLTTAARLPRLPRARGGGAVRAHRLGRRPGGDLGARRSLLHAARLDRAARDDRARHERAARAGARSGSPRSPARSRRRAPSGADPALGRARRRAGRRGARAASSSARRRAPRRCPSHVRHRRRAQLRPGARSPVTDELVTRMRETLAHRGPDGAATWVAPDGRVGLGFRRLAIIDLSDAAMQPMANEDGTSAARLQRRDLQPRRAAPRARAARPRLPHRPRRHRGDRPRASRSGGSTACTASAACSPSRSGTTGRRSSGSSATASAIKPLYWSAPPRRPRVRLRDQGAARGSAAGARRRRGVALPLPLVPHDPGAADAVPRASASSPAAPGCASTRGGDISGAALLGPVGRGRRPRRASRTPRSRRACSTSSATSVQLRKVSDVPVGVFLSGGIDSSTNAALFAEGESRAGQDVLDRLRRRLRELPERVRVRAADGRARRRRPPRAPAGVDDLLDFLPRMVLAAGRADRRPGLRAVYYVSKLARDNGVVVAQVGEGADELFFGYPSWRTLLQAPALRRPAGAARAQARRRRGAPGWRARTTGARSSTCGAAALGQPIFWGGAESFTEAQKQRLLVAATSARGSRPHLVGCDRADPATASRRAARERFAPELDELPRPEPPPARAAADARRQDVDGRRRSRGASRSSTTEFVGLALSIPEAAKTNGGTLKHVLKRRGARPDPRRADRPAEAGLRRPRPRVAVRPARRRPRAQELDAFCAETDLLDRDEVRRLLDAARARPGRCSTWRSGTGSSSSRPRVATPPRAERPGRTSRRSARIPMRPRARPSACRTLTQVVVGEPGERARGRLDVAAPHELAVLTRPEEVG